MDSTSMQQGKPVEILIVEDSPTQAEELKYILEEYGYRAFIATNGRKALAFLSDHRAALVISDIVMPEMDGYEMCRHLKSDTQFKDIPVILLTALSDTGDVIKALEVGADNFLTKPYDEKCLISRIQYLLANRRLYEANGVRLGMEIAFAGHKHFITSDRMQILNLLLSTYEAAVKKNEELRLAQEELRKLNCQLEQRVAERTAALQAEISEHKMTAGKLQRLNLVLRAIRDINQLIVREKDRRKLLKEVCQNLVGTRSYAATWIATWDESGKLLIAEESGMNENFLPLIEQMAQGKLPSCARMAMEKKLEVAVVPPRDCCNNCLFQQSKDIQNILISCLKASGKIYGVLVATASFHSAIEEDEQSLFQEVAGDIGFALHALEAEERQRQSEVKYQHLVEQIPVAVYTAALDATSSTQYQSPQIEKIVGYTAEEWSTQKGLWSERLHPDDRDRVLAELQRSHASGIPFRCEYRLKARDGHTVWVYDEASVVYDKANQPLFFHGVLSDITERKKMEESLRESNLRLEEMLHRLENSQQEMLRTERLRALGKMASGIAHDFNNALSPILGFSGLLLENPKKLADQQKAGHYLEMIHIAATQAVEVVRRLHEFYRKREEGEKFYAVNLNQVVEECISLTEPKWKDQARVKGIVIAIEHRLAMIPLASGNAPEIRDALMNLIFNAVDAIPSSGTITIRTYQDGEFLAMEVEDTGTGMTKETLQHCIEPFFTTKGQKGSGLGLATVYGMIQRCQGKIDIQSELGKGTKVTLRLPIWKGLPPQETTMEVATTPAPLHVLVVEDENAVRTLVTELLATEGHTFEEATNGREGLEKFAQGQYDLVITDRSMPEMNGDQLAVAIKKVSPRTPVILLTGFGDIMNWQGEHPDGCDIVLPKPVQINTLNKTIAMLIAQYKGSK